MSKENKCETCAHWYNKQRELNYLTDVGFCLNDKFKFNTRDGRLVGVVDLGNKIDRVKVSGESSHDIETKDGNIGGIGFSQYLLQTHHHFGCIYHEKSKAKQ